MSDDKDSLFAIYNGQGFSAVLVTIFGAKWLVGLIGVMLNGDLLYITIINRSIHSACNWLLALNALFNLCYQANHIIPLFISLSGRNFIELPLCFYLQLYSVFAVNCNLGISLSIGFDRMLCVLLPTWQNKSTSIYLTTITGLSSCYAIYIIFLCFQEVAQLPNLAVPCTALDCYQGDLGILVSRNASIFYLFNLSCYTVVWALFIIAAVKRETMKDTITQKLFKSLTVIMLMEIFSCSTNWVARIYLIPKLYFPAVDNLIISSLLSMLANLAMASNPLILYTFSAEYHRIFQKQLHHLFGNKIIRTRSVTSVVPTRGSTINNN